MQRRSHFLPLCNSASWNGHVYDSRTSAPFCSNPPAAQPNICPPDSSQHCLRQRRATSRDETTEGSLARGTSTSSTPSVQSTPKPNSSTPAAFLHTPKQTVGHQIHTCQPPVPMDLLHALCPLPCPLPSSACKNHCTLAFCTLAISTPPNSHTPHF